MSLPPEDAEFRSLLIAAERRAPDPEVQVVVDAERYERIARLRTVRRMACAGLALAALTAWSLLRGSADDDGTVSEPLAALARAVTPERSEALPHVSHPDDVPSRLRLERAAMTALVSARRATGPRRLEELRTVADLFEGTEAAEWATWSLQVISMEEKR